LESKNSLLKGILCNIPTTIEFKMQALAIFCLTFSLVKLMPEA
jgi:hypothetical protein